MLVAHGFLTHLMPELPGAALRLGRHLALDARSLAYTVERELGDAMDAVHIRPAAHPPTVPVMDQSATGSCTGNAGTYGLSALVRPEELGGITLGGYHLSSTDAAGDEEFARELYHEATQNDGLPGQWPPNDDGSTGLGVCRALREHGLVDRYTWATSLRGLGTLLQRGGVLVGMPWHSAFFEPDADGFIDADPHWSMSPIVGGHELYIAGMETWNDRDPHACVIDGPNQWSRSWGDDGWWRMRLSTYVSLKSGIDLKQLVRRAA